MKKLACRFLFLILLTNIASCASRPQLYPNQTLKSKGQDVAERDVDQCMADADQYLKSSKGKQIAKSTGAGAMIGGAIGTVAGLFTGNVGRGLAQGAAMGGAGGAASGAISPDELKHRYVNQCLHEKGYQVLGWD